jgi:hypothetical protein
MKRSRKGKSQTKKLEDRQIEGLPPSPMMGISAIEGAIAGGMVGAIAGPIGAIVGSALGSVAGIAAGAALEDDEQGRSWHDHELDREIGVEGGDIGHADPNMPPTRIGAFSAGSCGAGSASTPAPAAGPMQDLDADD